MTKMPLHFTLNGVPLTMETAPNKRLVDFLREDCGTLSVKEGCAEGECGACTVIFNGKLVTSCCMLAMQAEGAEIVTVEGLSDGKNLHPIQQAFLEAGAVQCGYCIPGMILAAKVILEQYPDPTDEQIRVGMAGNLCRCTGYSKIFAGVKLAAAYLNGKEAG